MHRYPVFPMVVVLLAWLPCPGQESGSKLIFDGGKAKQYVTYLSSDALQGRMTCTEGYRKAADWAASKFKEWGLQPAGEDGTYFQNVTIRDFDWNTGLPTLEVGGRKFLLDDEDFAVSLLSSPATTIRGEIIFVGYGIAAPDKGLDEYAGVDVKNRVVLAFRGSPKDAPQARRMFEKEPVPSKDEKKKVEEWKEESTDLAKVQTAHEKGAAAIMLFDPDEASEGSRRRGPPSRGSGKDQFKPKRKFLCFTVRERVFRAIMKKKDQESPRGLKRRMNAVRRLIKEKKAQSGKTGVTASLKGYDVSRRHDKENGNNIGRNVLAKIEGTDPELKKEYILTGAHLDHVGIRNGYVYNGADDNASGSGVVLEVARVLGTAKFKPKRTLVFCLWSGEERGLIGSRYYAEKPPDGVTMDQVATYFNIDMVGMGEELGASGALNYPSIWEVIKRGQEPDIMKRLKPRTGGPGGSDHTPFIERGIEALMLMSSGGVGHQDYHQPEDDAEKIEPKMLRITGQFVLQGMVNLSNEIKTKLLIDRRLQMYRALRMNLSNLNPALENSAWSQAQIKAKSKEALYEEIYKRARELLRTAASSRSMGRKPTTSSRSRRGSRVPFAQGLKNFKPIGDDMKLLELAIDYHGANRADLEGDDGVWIVEGRLTDVGKEAVKTLEKNNIAIRLVSPGVELIDDLLSAVSRPFIITGKYELTKDNIEKLCSRGVQLGVDLDPAKVDGFIERLEKAKHQLGERKNLFAYLLNTKGLDEAKRPLYLGLIDHGWAHKEICGTRGRQGLLNGANLHTISEKK